MPAANVPKHGVWSLFERFWRDRDGAVAVYSGIAIAVLVGFAGLVIDVSRVTTTETQLQYAADAAALAGAAELDGGIINGRDAIVRATEAARTAFVRNLQTHASGNSDVEIPQEGIRFLSALDPDVYTTDHAAARFIEVTTEARTVNNLLIQVVGGPDTSQIRARAVAGFTQAVCRSTPLMICNPAESPTNVGADFDGDALRGNMILLKQQGGSAQWAPGNFGLLEAQSGPGASNLKAEIATPNPTSCYGDRVNLQTGTINSIEEAFNVRFDIYPNGGQLSNKSDFPPARNVVKGDEWQLQGNAEPDAANFQKLPRDICLENGTCPFNESYPDRIGDGDWDAANYWDVNHGGSKPVGLPAAPTRYEVYRYEIEVGPIPDNSENTPPGEDGNPTNYPGTPPDGCPNIFNAACSNDISQVDRRRLVMAVVNCIEHNVHGSATNLPVVDYVDLFMTEPMDKGADQELAVEVIGSAGKSNYGIQGTMRDIVQLYR